MAEPGKYLIGESLREKLKSTIAKVDSLSPGGPVFRLPHGGISDGPAPYVSKVFRVCTAAGSWPVNSSKNVTFYGVTSTPNTVSVLNQLVSLPAPKSTTTTRIVNIAKDGTQWYLVSFQMSSKTAVMATNTQTITFMGTAATQAITFISSANTQTMSFADAGPDVTLTYVSSVIDKSLTYVSSVSDVEVIDTINATLDTTDCKITVTKTTKTIRTANNPQTTSFKVATDPQTKTFKTAGSVQTATVISLANTQTAMLMSTGGTQTATIMTGTYLATYISLEI
jgi:hypothetical protein